MASNEQLLDELGRTRDRQKSMRIRAERKMEQALDLGAVVAGGAAAGYVDAKWGEKKMLGMGINLAVAATALAVGVLEWGGKASGPIGFTGAGILAAEARKFVYDRTSKGGETAGLVGASTPRQLGPEMQSYTLDQMRDRLRSIAA